jgi:hypothetical protein
VIVDERKLTVTKMSDSGEINDIDTIPRANEYAAYQTNPISKHDQQRFTSEYKTSAIDSKSEQYSTNFESVQL